MACIVGLSATAPAAYCGSAHQDPHLTVAPKTHVLTASVYRRPLPATNLSFLSTVMFDGRETVAPLTSEATDAANLETDLLQQASDATTGHAQATAPPSQAQLMSIVSFDPSCPCRFGRQRCLYVTNPSRAGHGPVTLGR